MTAVVGFPAVSDVLTGEAQAAYLDVLMRHGSVGVDATRLRRDARTALCSRKHLNRLRYAAVRPSRMVPPTSQTAWSCRAPRARVPRCRTHASGTRPKTLSGVARPGRLGTLTGAVRGV